MPPPSEAQRTLHNFLYLTHTLLIAGAGLAGTFALRIYPAAASEAEVGGELDFLTYLASQGIAWTLGYDTIYAHQDKEDDVLVGVKSLALRLGTQTRPWLFVFYAAAVLCFAAAGHAVGLGWPFYLLLAPAALQLLWQAARVDLDNPADCLRKFRSNRLFGWLLLGAIIAGLPYGSAASVQEAFDAMFQTNGL